MTNQRNKSLGRWIYDHPILAFLAILTISFVFLMVLVYLTGCSARPPRRYSNGDRTVYGPKTYGSVDEADMAHGTIFNSQD
jgi:hypothetical protein